MAGGAVRARRIALAAAVSAAIVFAGPASGEAQSLADIARQEAERRKTIAVPGKVYTNDDLVPDFTRPPAPEPPAGATGDAAPTAPDASTAGGAAGSAAAGAERAPEPDQDGVTPRALQEPQPGDDKNEAFWRSQAQLIRSRLARQNTQIADLRARLEAFAPGAADGEKAIVQATLEKAVADLAFLNDEWLRFERWARERNVPAHWIR
jgi:hypothetical protein